MGKFWLLGGIFLASPGFSTKVWGKGGQYKPSGENKGTSKGTFLLRRVIQGYNSRRWFFWTLFCIKVLNCNKLFQLSHDCVTENARQAKFLWEATRDLFLQYMVCYHGRDGMTQFFGGEWYPTRGKSSNFLSCRGSLPKVAPIVGYPDLPLRKILRKEIGLLTVMIFKRVSKSIFFQSIKFTACKVNDS